MITELADNVRKYRRRAGMSQEELAHAAGVRRARYARPSRAAPSAWRPCTRLPARLG
ncbi:helix-turn-helix domain-containing protein [Kitasatospora sp. NPDC088264]|uniref:helix-turn-helix transcriptional regulator n=1 Tax=Kitasatospora sp. NPDC088264 TaxID=3155296 RepID=UPI00341A3F6A